MVLSLRVCIHAIEARGEPAVLRDDPLPAAALGGPARRSLHAPGVIDYTALPALNASLNATSAVLLLVGWTFIRRGDMRRHRLCMLSAFAISPVPDAYLCDHAHVGSVPFTGRGAVRVAYFAILITHVVLAAVILPLALVTLSRALSRRFDRHRAIARWTLPIWLMCP